MNSKPWYQSKTLLVNILLGLVAILGYIIGPDFPIDLSQHADLIMFVIALANALLRLVTTKPVSLK